MPHEDQVIAAGPLRVRYVRDGMTSYISLAGELDLSCTSTAEELLQRALQDGCQRILVDLRGLELIDSTGIALLVRAIDEDSWLQLLRFVPSDSPAVSRMLEMTGVSELMRPDGDASLVEEG